MGSRTLFSLRVIRCPACHARLPVEGGETMVTCEYCDARVQLCARGAAPRPAKPQPATRPAQVDAPSVPPPTHTATPHYSGFAWVVLLVPLLSTLGVATSVFMSLGIEIPWDDLRELVYHRSEPEVPKTPDSRDTVRSEGALATVPPEADERGEDEEEEDQEEDVGRVGRFFSTLSERAEQAETKNAKPKPNRPRAAPTPGQPTGPILSVAEAKKQLEPEILKCLKAAGVHRVTARMGNKSVGGVSVLEVSSAPRPRVDGAIASKFHATKLGRCMNEAGQGVRTEAFGGNYIIVDVRNADVPDPLGDLPVRPSSEALDAALAPLDGEVKACAKRHGEAGRSTRIRVRIDGPSGKVLSVDATRTKKAFERCVEPLYKKTTMPRSRTETFDHHYDITL